MSDSRLEKFIYAICSMEVSDLPAPLSRIEKLWNCLITGETPDFEPQSRNEQYLMAMLDRYDISNLPAPMSRGEKLLYKIAVGETDLSDVPGYLSRYEELLKYLIENGGISGGDFEYVLHTLNQSLSTLYTTAEKPVKSAILKGQTLVNLLDAEILKGNKGKINVLFNVILEDDYFVSNHGNGQFQIFNDDGKSPFEGVFEEGKTYTLIMDVITTDKTGDGGEIYLELNTTTHTTTPGLNFNNANGIIKRAFKATKRATPEIKSVFKIGFYDNAITKINRKIMLLEGDYTNVDIPYFEGMQSVKMPVLKTTGKNLLCSENFVFNGSLDRIYRKIYLKPNTDYYMSAENEQFFSYRVMLCKNDGDVNVNKTPTELIPLNSNASRKFNSGNYSGEFFILFHASRLYADYANNWVQVEEGSTPTAYEPFKSNILTVNEDVTLRGIGDVQDELDCLTGEVTERIGEIVLDETLDYRGSSSANGENTMYFQFDLGAYPSSTPISHYFKVSSANLYVSDNDYEAIRITGSGALQLRILKSKLPTTDTDGVKEFFKQNNISIQYQLATESIKTVDLTTVDQDGQPTKLKTFNDISYVEINADNLIPSVDVEVATKINETLSTLDPQQNDISNTQNKLSQTIDEQTENTDAAMLATTEIYEQTL